MLIDQDDADVLALAREPVKGLLDRRSLRLGVDDKEVLLHFGGGRDMLHVVAH